MLHFATAMSARLGKRTKRETCRDWLNRYSDQLWVGINIVSVRCR